jgi:L-amino acid N-acyltransferase YncA
MIRVAKPEDLPEVFNLFDARQSEMKYQFGKGNREIFIHSWTKLFPENSYMVLKSVDDNGKMDGFLCGNLYYHIGTGAPMAMVHFWYVIPSKRKSGIGRELLKEFEKWAKSNGIKFIWTAKKYGKSKLGGYQSHETMYVKEL